jgi:hypothetical protein
MSSHTDATVFKETVERLLDWRVSKASGTRRLRPHLDNKLICYIEDLHLAYTDPYGDQPAVEAIRDYLTQGAWLSSRKRRWREIEEVSFYACMSINAPETPLVSGRVLHQFNLIALDVPSTKTIHDRYQTLADIMVLAWPSAMQMYSTDIVGALVDLNLKVFQHLKPTPMKAHYAFNWRDFGRLLASI